MLSATRFVVAGAIVALYGGSLLVAMPTTEGGESDHAVGASPSRDSTSRPIQLPSDIPSDVESGTLDTPLGQARWVHLTGDEDTLPATLTGLLATPDGYVVPEFDQWVPSERGARLWRSSDLIEWRPEALGIEGKSATLSQAGDTYWLSTEQPGSLWWSADTVSWDEVNLEALHPPGPARTWTLQHLSEPVTYRGTTIVPLSWAADRDTEVLGLGILEQGALVAIEPPLAREHPRQQAYMADGDGFVAYTLGPDDPSTLSPDPLVHVHRSQDGREWSETDIIGDDPGELRVVESIVTRHGLVRLHTASNRTWTVADDLEREPFPPGGIGFWVGAGWVQAPFGQSWLAFVPVEGATMRVERAALSFPAEACVGDHGLLSSNTFGVVGDGDCASPREAWMITLDDMPA